MPQQENYALSSNIGNDGRLFVMQDMYTAIAGDLDIENVWYVDSDTTNHMTHHHNRFSKMKEPRNPSYIEIGDDTIHPIEHVGNVFLSMEDEKETYMVEMLHVPTMTKYLVHSVKWLKKVYKYDSMNMAVLLKFLGTSASWLVKDNKNGRMFILNVTCKGRYGHVCTLQSLTYSTRGLGM